jgi:hypothetical protein
VASITAATWLLELWLRTSLKETEHEKGLSVLAASIPLQAARLAAYLTLLPCNLEVNNHSFRNSLKEKPSPFSARMEFWRGTACEKHSSARFEGRSLFWRTTAIPDRQPSTATATFGTK